MRSPLRLIVNEGVRRLDRLFPGYFPTIKHDHYKDFGFPDTLDFKQFFDMYSRNSLAKAAVNKTVAKTWQDNPFLLEKERDGSQDGSADETKLERDVRLRFDELRLWTKLAEVDRRSLVGAYSGLILRFADSQPFERPVARVPGLLLGLVEVIPAWEGQLTVSQWDTDQRSPTYGQPTMFSFNEANVGTNQNRPRVFNIHPDRVLIWSADGTVNGTSALEAGFNDLMTMEKVVGAGGEGFWKNAKSSPVLEMDKEADINAMARVMGVPVSEIADKMNAQVEDFSKGFDKMLMLQGIEAKTLGITLPSPEHFFAIALQSFAASFEMPVKILVGMQTGERASTEDADEWSQTNNSRRNNQAIPNIKVLVNRLVRVGILPQKDWYVDWTDLTETSMVEKIDRASKMADVNQKMKDSGEFIFTPDEIRAAVDYEPLSESDKYRDDTTEDDVAAAGGGIAQ